MIVAWLDAADMRLNARKVNMRHLGLILNIELFATVARGDHWLSRRNATSRRIGTTGKVTGRQWGENG